MDYTGLTEAEAEARLKEFGPNVLAQQKKKPVWKIVLAQFSSPIILMLIVIAIVSFAINNLSAESDLDTILILIIVFISAIAGFFQDYKAEKSVEALQKMLSIKVKVHRDGIVQIINTENLVPGDLIELEAGDIVPADAKLIKAIDLEIDESSLTGESEAVTKEKNQDIFMNTTINAGKALAVVSETGTRTQMGKLAKGLGEDELVNEEFNKELKDLTNKIIIFTVLIIIFMFTIAFFKYGAYNSFMLAVSLAVAAIPEGLPAVVTLTLALGANRMSKENALVRKMSVIETLGSVNIICTDKTGTLTENNMQVRKIYFNGHILDHGEFEEEKLEAIIKCGVLCNNSNYVKDSDGNKLVGSQTEIALRKVGEELNIHREDLLEHSNIVKEIPFSSSRKKMSVVIEEKEKYKVYTKGALEFLIDDCKYVHYEGQRVKLTEELKNKILKINKEFADQALRVIAFAHKKTKELEEENTEIESGLTFLGLQAMMDPPRKEVKEAIKKSKAAGIRVIMITGDSPDTAHAIAQQIGIESQGTLTGLDLSKMEDKELEEKLASDYNIFARTSPFHKRRILELLQKTGVVAMTGDGVNDSLAIKEADVGISMGIRGTEVSKQASDIILLDDNFSTITVAIKEGRAIFDNIKKFINYLFTCNLAEVSVIFLATLILSPKDPVLLPIHILWINLLTDGLPALALGIDPARPGIMEESPRAKNSPILDKKLFALIIAIGVKKSVILFMTFLAVLPHGFDTARTTLLTGFVLYEFVRIAVIRKQEKLSFLANPWLNIALIASLVLQVFVIYSPLNEIFHLKILGIYEWSILIGGTLLGYITAIFISNWINKKF